MIFAKTTINMTAVSVRDFGANQGKYLGPAARRESVK